MATSPLEIILHGANILRATMRTINSSKDLLNQDIPQSTKIYAIAARVLGLSFSVYEANAIIHNASTEDLLWIKDLELVEKIFETWTCLEVARVKSHLIQPEKPFSEQIAALFEEELLYAGLEFARVWNEREIFTEQSILDNPPDNSKDPHMHFHDENSITSIFDAYPHQRNLEIELNVDLALSTACSILESRPFSKMFEMKEQQQLRRDAQGNERRLPMPNANFHVPAERSDVDKRLIELRKEKQNQNVEDLLSLSFIPEHFYERDPESIFRKFECCISKLPARHPVEDLTAKGERKVIYDEIEILTYLEHLQKSHKPFTSPITKLPLRIEDLKPMRAAQRLIDSKLRSFQERWSNLLKERPELQEISSPPLKTGDK